MHVKYKEVEVDKQIAYLRGLEYNYYNYLYNLLKSEWKNIQTIYHLDGHPEGGIYWQRDK